MVTIRLSAEGQDAASAAQAHIRFASSNQFPEQVREQSFVVESTYSETEVRHAMTVIGDCSLHDGGAVGQFLTNEKIQSASVQFTDQSLEQQQGFLLGLQLGAYRFDKYKSTRAVDAVVEVQGAHPEAIQFADSFASGTLLARDLINEEPNTLYPETYSERVAKHFEGTSVEVTVLSPEAYPGFEKEFAGTSAVGRGSYRSPRVVVLRYKTDPTKPLTAFVGKGITFDTGGISLKISRDISDMKMDMGGSGAVVGAFDILSRMNAQANVIGILLMAENRPGHNSFLPGEIIRYANGKTVEVRNTDAEGRLALADGLIYVQKEGATDILEISTLTGAAAAALGPKMSAIFGDRTLAAAVQESGRSVGEKHWELPMEDSYRKLLKGSVSDLKNITDKNWGGSITAALFLDAFVDGVPFVHFDIAGPMESPSNDGIHTVGATGFGARTFAQYVLGK